MNNDEKNLLLQVAAGDQQAFEILVTKYWKNIFGQAMAYCKSVPIAQEIVQDVFLKIWLKKESLPGIDNFENYLFIVARNQIITVFRRNLGAPVKEQLSNTEQAFEEGTWLPDKQLHAKQFEELVDKAIDLLPPQRKTIFRLSRLEGLSYSQIAERLGISRNTVKEHIVKSLNFIRTYLHIHLLLFFSLVISCLPI